MTKVRPQTMCGRSLKQITFSRRYPQCGALPSVYVPCAELTRSLYGKSEASRN